MWYDRMSFSNDCGNLRFHRSSLKGKVTDYVITFHKTQMDILMLINDTYALFSALLEKYPRACARLIAKVHFKHLGKDNEEEDRFYHFSSYRSEEVVDAKEFFTRHMLKISQRLDDFNVQGSNLVIHSISHIHIQLSCK